MSKKKTPVKLCRKAAQKFLLITDEASSKLKVAIAAGDLVEALVQADIVRYSADRCNERLQDIMRFRYKGESY